MCIYIYVQPVHKAKAEERSDEHVEGRSLFVMGVACSSHKGDTSLLFHIISARWSTALDRERIFVVIVKI